MAFQYTVHSGPPEHFTCPAVDSAGGLRHLFTTRLGGVSTGPLKSLNLGMSREEPYANKLANYRIACGAAGIDPESLVLSKQTHGTVIVTVTAADRGKGLLRESNITDADGLITSSPDVAVAVFYADCVPILLYDPVRRVVAAVHAGWRGTVAGIAPKAARRMHEEFACRPADVLACIGPSIGPCCFETGEEPAAAFDSAGLGHTICRSSRVTIDLWAANAALLERAGLSPRNISIMGQCTACQPERLYSHRACGANTGRMALIAQLI